MELNYIYNSTHVYDIQVEFLTHTLTQPKLVLFSTTKITIHLGQMGKFDETRVSNINAKQLPKKRISQLLIARSKGQNMKLSNRTKDAFGISKMSKKGKSLNSRSIKPSSNFFNRIWWNARPSIDQFRFSGTVWLIRVCLSDASRTI